MPVLIRYAQPPPAPNNFIIPEIIDRIEGSRFVEGDGQAPFVDIARTYTPKDIKDAIRAIKSARSNVVHAIHQAESAEAAALAAQEKAELQQQTALLYKDQLQILGRMSNIHSFELWRSKYGFAYRSRMRAGAVLGFLTMAAGNVVANIEVDVPHAVGFSGTGSIAGAVYAYARRHHVARKRAKREAHYS